MMYPDALSLVLAAGFTAGCMVIHSRSEHADDVAVVLILMLIGLMHLLGAGVASRTDRSIDLVAAAEVASRHPRLD
jgi:hypothetical protein